MITLTNEIQAIFLSFSSWAMKGSLLFSCIFFTFRKEASRWVGHLQYGWWQQAHPHLDGNFFQRCLKRFDDTIRLNSLKLKKHANSFIMIWVCAVLVFHSSTFSNSSNKQQYITQVISQRVVKIENLTQISWISEFLFVTPKMSKNGIH